MSLRVIAGPIHKSRHKRQVWRRYYCMRWGRARMQPKCCLHFASILSACWFAASVRSDQRGRRGNVGQRAPPIRTWKLAGRIDANCGRPCPRGCQLASTCASARFGYLQAHTYLRLKLVGLCVLGRLGGPFKGMYRRKQSQYSPKKLQTVCLTWPSLPQVLGNLQGCSCIVALSTCGRRVLASRIDWIGNICATCLQVYMLLRAQRSSQTKDVG
jgi:hypothetical protein